MCSVTSLEEVIGLCQSRIMNYWIYKYYNEVDRQLDPYFRTKECDKVEHFHCTNVGWFLFLHNK